MLTKPLEYYDKDFSLSTFKAKTLKTAVKLETQNVLANTLESVKV